MAALPSAAVRPVGGAGASIVAVLDGRLTLSWLNAMTM